MRPTLTKAVRPRTRAPGSDPIVTDGAGGGVGWEMGVVWTQLTK